MPQEWTCTLLDASTTQCTVTASTTQEVASTTVPYGDWLMYNSLILFCVAFIPVSALFSLLAKRR